MFIFYIVIALLLTQVPLIGKYFRLFNTLIHEIGHVLAALITGGKVNHIKLNFDESGIASSGTSKGLTGYISKVITTLTGYPFASGISLLFIIMLHKEQFDYIMYSMIGLVIVSLIFWIRNLFGIIWLLIAGVLTFGLLIHGDVQYIQIYAKVLVAVIFVDSFMSTIDLFKIVRKNKNDAGDAHNLKTYTGISEYVWSILFILIACIPIYISFPLWF